MEKTTQARNFEIENGLGKISFSSELITSIIKNVLSSYQGYVYLSHTIDMIQDNYFEVSIQIKIPDELKMKEIDRLHKDLLLVMKQSLGLTCVVAINLKYGK